MSDSKPVSLNYSALQPSPQVKAALNHLITCVGTCVREAGAQGCWTQGYWAHEY